MSYVKIYIFIISLALSACNLSDAQSDTHNTKPSTQFNAYWYNGLGEINVYTIEQRRYGQPREGKSIFIFVTEHFNAEKQVKSNSPSSKTKAILKLNKIDRFITGIYDYSTMLSVFSAIYDDKRLEKLSHTVQDWCGQTFLQINRKKDAYRIQSRSYFERESDKDLTIRNVWFEDELWNQVRLDPSKLPQGTINVLRNCNHLRFKHTEFKAVKAIAKNTTGSEISIYTLHFPDLHIRFDITYDSAFPHTIRSWKEYSSHDDSYIIYQGTLDKQIRSAYWNQSGNAFQKLRKELGI